MNTDNPGDSMVTYNMVIYVIKWGWWLFCTHWVVVSTPWDDVQVLCLDQREQLIDIGIYYFFFTILILEGVEG